MVDLASRSFTIPSEFYVDESYYLDKNPDVAAAISAGHFSSATDHFCNFGILEGRPPNDKYGDQYLRWLRALSPFAEPIEQGSLIEAKVQKLILTSGIEFFQALDASMHWRTHGTGSGYDRFKANLVQLLPKFGDREKIFTFNWLLANHEHEDVAHLLQEVIKIQDWKILPSLAKSVDAYYLDVGKLSEFRETLLQKFFSCHEYRAFISGDLKAFEDDLVRSHAAELVARYNSYSDFRLPSIVKHIADRQYPSHVFVGFFGQLRFPEETLSKLCDMIKSTIRAEQLTFGLSTWSTQGVRQIEDEDPINFAAEQLPPEFSEFFVKNGIHSFFGFSQSFPSLALLLRTRGAASQIVNEKLVRELCASEVYTAIDSDGSYMQNEGAIIADAFQNQPHMVSQGKMWNRISRIGDLIVTAEKDKGPVTDVILLRSDLVISGGLEHAARYIAGSLASDGRVLVDYDAHAINLSGVGDRIFVGKRNSIGHLIDGQKIMQSALRGKALAKELFYWFFSMHTYPQTLLYQSGCNCVNITDGEFSVRIYRGRLTWEKIAEAVESDAMNSPKSSVRDFLSMVVSGNRL